MAVRHGHRVSRAFVLGTQRVFYYLHEIDILLTGPGVASGAVRTRTTRVVRVRSRPTKGGGIAASRAMPTRAERCSLSRAMPTRAERCSLPAPSPASPALSSSRPSTRSDARSNDLRESGTEHRVSSRSAIGEVLERSARRSVCPDRRVSRPSIWGECASGAACWNASNPASRLTFSRRSAWRSSSESDLCCRRARGDQPPGQIDRHPTAPRTCRASARDELVLPTMRRRLWPCRRRSAQCSSTVHRTATRPGLPIPRSPVLQESCGPRGAPPRR